jgi:signal transduction histidine kinase
MSQIPFTVSAKAARLIGRENFANAEGAVIELVKNCYDADASLSVVFIDTLNDCIYIIDNGDGMTSKTIEEKWMTIGTDDKEVSIKTTNKRIKTGAKGIGRFAMDRLGYAADMTTKVKNTEGGQNWKIDWRQFEGKGKVIQQIKANLEPIVLLDLKNEVKSILKDLNLDNSFFDYWNDNKGTIIKIVSLRDDWRGVKNKESSEVEENVMAKKLSADLEDLVSPLENDIFKAYLFHAEFKDRYGLLGSEKIEDYDYRVKIKYSIDETVKVTIWQNEINLSAINDLGFFTKIDLSKKNKNYSFETFKHGQFSITKSLIDLLPYYDSIDTDLLSEVGLFEVDLYFLKRGPGEESYESDDKIYNYKYADYSKRKKWLNRFGGVKIYRDNFRVRPYGDPRSDSFDWLALRSRSARSQPISKGEWRLNDRQAYGTVKITRLGNIGLEDKSNREGLKDSEAFILFKQIVVASINIFEQERTRFFRALLELYKINNPEEVKIEKGKQIAKKIKQKKKTNGKGSTDNNTELNGSNTNENTENTNQEDVEDLVDAFDIQQEEIKDAQENQRILQSLASTGLLVTSFAHDLENLSGNLLSRSKRLKRSLEGLIDKNKLNNLQDFENPFVKIEQMQAEDAKLRKWLEFAISSVKMSKRRKRNINLQLYFQTLRESWNPFFNERQINIVLTDEDKKDVTLNCNEIDLDSTFTNLISNSMEAFYRKDSGEFRKITIGYGKLSEEEIYIDYEDSGPGLSRLIEDPYRIFDLWYSTKKDGTGLGMWIVKTAIENYDGIIQMIEYRTKFKIRFIFPLKSTDDV